MSDKRRPDAARRLAQKHRASESPLRGHQVVPPSIPSVDHVDDWERLPDDEDETVGVAEGVDPLPTRAIDGPTTRGPGRPRGGVADVAFEAAGGDPLLALLIVLDLIRDGRLIVNRCGYSWVDDERIAA